MHAVPLCPRLVQPTGTQLAELPVEPMMGAALLAGSRTGCAEEVATALALLSVRSVWVRRGEQQAFEEARSR